MPQQPTPYQQQQVAQWHAMNPPEVNPQQAQWAQQTGNVGQGPMQDSGYAAGFAPGTSIPGGTTPTPMLYASPQFGPLPPTPSGMTPASVRGAILPGVWNAASPGGALDPASNYLPRTPLGQYNQQQTQNLNGGAQGLRDFAAAQDAAAGNPAINTRNPLTGQPTITSTGSRIGYEQTANTPNNMSDEQFTAWSNQPHGPNPQQGGTMPLASAAQFAAMNHSIPYQTNPAYAPGNLGADQAAAEMAGQRGLHVLPMPTSGGGTQQVVSAYDTLNHPSVYDNHGTMNAQGQLPGPMNSYGRPIFHGNSIEGTYRNPNPLREGASPQEAAVAMKRMGPENYWAARAAAGQKFTGPMLAEAGMPQPPLPPPPTGYEGMPYTMRYQAYQQRMTAIDQMAEGPAKVAARANAGPPPTPDTPPAGNGAIPAPPAPNPPGGPPLPTTGAAPESTEQAARPQDERYPQQIRGPAGETVSLPGDIPNGTTPYGRYEKIEGALSHLDPTNPLDVQAAKQWLLRNRVSDKEWTTLPPRRDLMRAGAGEGRARMYQWIDTLTDSPTAWSLDPSIQRTNVVQAAPPLPAPSSQSQTTPQSLNPGGQATGRQPMPRPAARPPNPAIPFVRDAEKPPKRTT
jgi:hypothetical protein